jgi:hypothetical protein
VPQGAQNTDLADRHGCGGRARVYDNRNVDVVDRAPGAEHHSSALQVPLAEAVAVHHLVAGFPNAAHHSRGTAGELLRNENFHLAPPDAVTQRSTECPPPEGRQAADVTAVPIGPQQGGQQSRG